MKYQWQKAPIRTEWGSGMVVGLLEIDKDHTLQLYCEDDQVDKVEAMLATKPVPTMTKAEALKLIKLLSAVESWSFSMKATLPDYLHEDLCLAVEKLEKIVLEKSA